VIGAGQAGLSASRILRERGVEHLVLERGRVAETWRSQRWDGFILNTPNWATQLPGYRYRGSRPDAFAPLAEIIELLDDYAREAPVRTHARAARVRPDDGAWVVETDDDSLRAAHVIVATGAYQLPTLPQAARSARSTVMQIHSSAYRSPEQLLAGTVLVVGSGQSGCQIAEELLAAGRDVVLSVGRCGWFPRRSRGRDLIAWAVELGMMDDTVDTVAAEARRGCNPALSGNDDGHDCHARWLGGRGAVLAGRVDEIADGAVRFAPDLQDNLAFADEFARKFVTRVDDHVAERELAAPPAEPLASEHVAATAGQLDVADVGAIVWATGYRSDYAWIDAPRDEAGMPVHVRGVSPSRGLYFVGVPWLHKRKSPLLLGVGEDAAHVVTHVCESRAR